MVLKLGHFGKDILSEILVSVEIWHWQRTQKISWTYRVRNEEVLRRVKEERNTLHTIKRSKANWTGHMLRRKCL
jgi:hypothetical protein